MTTRARWFLGLAIALLIPGLCFIAFRPEHATVLERAFDVSTQASLEPSCAREFEASTRPVLSTLIDESGRWYQASQWGPQTDPLRAYRVSVSFDFQAYHEAAHALGALMADSWTCEFRPGARASLRIRMSGRHTRRDVENTIRELAAWARVTEAQLDAAITEFEAGVGLDVRDWANDGDQAVRVERPGLTLLFRFDDAEAARWGHAASQSEPPKQAPPDEPRYAVSVWFVPAI